MTRCIVLPQKQVGSAQFRVGPIIKNRICAPQNRFGHSHNSSRLFFTNATSARSTRRVDAPVRCVRPHRAVRFFRPGAVHQNGLLPIIWLSDNRLPEKTCSPLTITTATPAVGFHPKFPI
jgi:hypothetical protein